MISLSNISHGRPKPPKLVVYSVGGWGKTTLASEAPSPMFICTEEGRGRLKFPAFQRSGSNSLEPTPEGEVMQSWAEILECVNVLYSEKHDFQTVVLDTLDFAEPLLWRHTCGKGNKADIEDFGYGKGYTKAVEEARVLLAGFDALRDERNMMVIILAHSAVKRFESPDHEPYDRFKLRVNDKLAELVHDWSDAQLFGNWRAHVVKDKGKFDNKNSPGSPRGVGTGERVLFTEERPAFWAKNRYGLPSEIIMPRVPGSSWQLLQDAISLGMSVPDTASLAAQPEPQQQLQAQGT